MKNGYTPKEFAHSVAIDHLYYVMRSITLGQYDHQLTQAEQKKVISAITTLRISLANKARLDII